MQCKGSHPCFSPVFLRSNEIRSSIPKEKFAPVLLPFHLLSHFLPYTQRQRNYWREEGRRLGNLFKRVSLLGSSSSPLLVVSPGQPHDPWWGERLEVCGEVFLLSQCLGGIMVSNVWGWNVSHPAVCGAVLPNGPIAWAEKHHTGLSCPVLALPRQF